MAEDNTASYHFVLPEVGGSADTWGTKLNQNWTDLDEYLLALQDTKLAKASNLSDLENPSAARTSLGLHGAAILNVGATAGTVAAGDDARIVGAAQTSANLSDLSNKVTARDNLGLGTAATRSVGAATGQVAAGDDGRITGAAQKAANLSDLQNPETARTNLGLGSLAVRGAVDNAVWSGAALAVANGGTGAATAPTARANLGLGNVDNISSVDIRAALTRANIETALGGKAPARMASGLGPNAGRISWGTTVPASLDEGEIFLRHS